jgi:hypothetical protein
MMTFSSVWDEIAGDEEGIDIEVPAGTHDPEWENLSREERSIISVGAGAAEDIMGELWSAGTEDKVRYRVGIEGNLPKNDTPGGFMLTVTEIISEVTEEPVGPVEEPTESQEPQTEPTEPQTEGDEGGDQEQPQES